MILRLFLDGNEVGGLSAPEDFGTRDWILAVAAVQISVEGGHVVAQLRAHATGTAAARIWPIAGGTRIDFVFSIHEMPVDFPSLPDRDAIDCAARLEAFLDGDLVGDSILPHEDLSLDPPPRAFAHVFGRFFRDGGCESRFDLTDFESQPHGEKYLRSVARPLTVGEVVTYRFT